MAGDGARALAYRMADRAIAHVGLSKAASSLPDRDGLAMALLPVAEGFGDLAESFDRVAAKVAALGEQERVAREDRAAFAARVTADPPRPQIRELDYAEMAKMRLAWTMAESAQAEQAHVNGGGAA